MSSSFCKRFSADGKYFAHLSSNGKLDIWNTTSNSLEQEYTPDFHLNTPCTCLEFLQNEANIVNHSPHPKKKKRKEDPSVCPHIILGTTTGLLLIYSISKAAIECKIDSNTNSHINCITRVQDNLLFAGADKHVLEWDLKKKVIKSQWKAGNEVICSILLIPNSRNIITAAKNIKLWNTETKEVIRTFAGHSSDIVCMYYIHSSTDADDYLLTGSKDSHILACWNLTKKSSNSTAACHFLMNDDVCNVAISQCSTGASNIAATTKTGSVHIYQHKLNEKCHKSIKCKSTIQVVADNDNSSEIVKPVPIFGATFRDSETLCICYGTEINLTFENITISFDKKMQCLIRKTHINNKISKKEQATKNRTAIIGNDVNYLSSKTAVVQGKRKSGENVGIPMEQRLENLTLNNSDGPKKVPKADHVGQLLLQGLHSKNKDILRAALCTKNENVIINTVKRLPVVTFEEFLREITSFIDGKTLMSTYGALWLKHFLQIQAGLLISNPNLSEMFSGILSSIRNRIAMQMPLHNLSGKLELLVPQIHVETNKNDDNDEALFVFNDKDSECTDSEDEENEEVQKNGIISLDSEIEDWEENDNEENMDVDSVVSLSDEEKEDE